MQIGILESKDFSKIAIEQLKSISNVSFLETQDVYDFIEDKDILFVRLKYDLNSDFLDRAQNLKIICTPTTGLNHIDIQECKKRDIKVISLKGEYEFLSSIRATPEHTFGLALSLLRNYKNAFLSSNNDVWNRERYKGYELFGNKIGIIGYGRVGKILAKYYDAFDAKVYYYDIQKIKEKNLKNIQKVDSLEKVIEKSNIVFLTASYEKENFEFFDKKYLDLLKNKYFINTSRGELVDENYLIGKIQENHFAGVALDVIQNEQSENKLNELIELTKERNLIITSHIAGATYSSMYRTEEFIVSKLLKVLELNR